MEAEALSEKQKETYSIHLFGPRKINCNPFVNQPHFHLISVIVTYISLRFVQGCWSGTGSSRAATVSGRGCTNNCVSRKESLKHTQDAGRRKTRTVWVQCFLRGDD